MGDARSRVLVIDDDADMRWAVRQVLADGGLDVAEANSGRSGLEILAASPPDAVLLDMQMPGLEGREVMRHLKRSDAHLPVVVLTGYGSISGAVEATSMSCYRVGGTAPINLDIRVIAATRLPDTPDLPPNFNQVMPFSRKRWTPRLGGLRFTSLLLARHTRYGPR